MDRAYSTIELKAVDDDARVIEGIASTPTPDRMNDIVEPMGAEFKLPLPFLWQHRHDQPIGHVTYAKPTKAGIPFRVQLVKWDEPGLLKDELDRAWQSIKARLVRAVSIGFRVLAYEIMENHGWRITSWEWLELSAVTIPANSDATINTIKSIDRGFLAASGRKEISDRRDTPGVSGQATSRKGNNTMKDLKEQIAEIETRRAQIADDMKAFGDVADLDGEQAAEYDALVAEMEGTNQPLTRLRALEQALSTSTPARGNSPEQARSSRRVEPEAKKPELPKGTKFARFAMAVAAGRGSLSDTLAYAKKWDSQTPEVSAYIKATIGTAVEASPGWGSQLVDQDTIASEFIELLRPATVMGRIEGWRRVPFNIRIPRQSAGATVDWVGEAGSKPISNPDFDDVTLPYHKIAGIVVMSEELVRLSSPSAEETVRRDLVEQVSRFMDAQLLLPAVTATANRPASITNGVAATVASGTDGDALRYDIAQAMAPMDAAELPGDTLVAVMPRAVARGIAGLTNALGQKEFPGFTRNGGDLDGIPALVSNSAPAGYIVFIEAGEILLADDGTVRLDASNQATLRATAEADPTISLWQENLIAVRAERWVTYKKRRSAAVSVISGAAYGPQSDSSPS